MSDTPKIIAINGPPRSGKDTVAKIINKLTYNCFDIKMAASLKTGCHTLLGLEPNPDTYEKIKDEISEDFMGNTPRDFYIRVSENLIKPMMGKQTFGFVWLRTYNRILYSGYNDPDLNYTVTISDCGFYEELAPLFKHFGDKGIAIIRLHRQGCDFARDSRTYIHFGNKNVPQFDVTNTNSEFQLVETVREILKHLDLRINEEIRNHEIIVECFD